MTTRFRLSDGRLVSHEIGVTLPGTLPAPYAGEFLPPNTLHRFGPSDLAARGITVEELPPDPPPTIDVENLRAQFLVCVDDQAETERMKYITGGSGMAMTYQEKLTQARAKLAGGEGPFPLLAASVPIEGADEASVAALVVQRYEAWLQIGAAIEGTRLRTKRDLAAASTEAELRDIFNALTWGVP